MKKTNKGRNKLTIIICVLLVILLSMISFCGIYTYKNGNYKNIVEKFDLAMELKGHRLLILTPSTETKTITKDSEGNVVEEEATEENGYTEEEVPANSDDVLTEENYNKSKEIIENRLKELAFDEYIIKNDVDTGSIVLELDENDDTDKTVASLYTQGKFEIKDSETKEVLMNNSMVKKAEVLYGSTTNGTSVYLSIEFNKEGREKFKEITTNYKTVEKSDSDENSSEESEDKTEEEQKEITMELDGQTMITTSFDSPIENGKLQLNVGQASKDADSLQEYVDQAKNVVVLLDSGNMPIEYTVSTNKYFKSNVLDYMNKEFGIVILVLFAAVSVLLIARYKVKGLISTVLSIGYIAILLLVIRYANVKVSLDGIVAIIISVVANYILQLEIIKNALKDENEKMKLSKVFAKYIYVIAPVFIISLAFTFTTSLLLNSFGMILFWGIVITFIYNLIFVKIYE